MYRISADSLDKAGASRSAQQRHAAEPKKCREKQKSFYLLQEHVTAHSRNMLRPVCDAAAHQQLAGRDVN
jgi:hypothetical protein